MNPYSNGVVFYLVLFRTWKKTIEYFLCVCTHLNKHKSGVDQLPEKSVKDCHLDVRCGLHVPLKESF